MQFKDVCGLKGVKEQLISSVHNNKLAHALMILGENGRGGLPLALAFAQYLNCEDPVHEDSCGVCSSCNKMSKFIHPDVHFSFPFVNKGKSSKPNISNDYLVEWRKAITENPYLNYYTWLTKIDAENKQGNINLTECHSIIKKFGLKAYEGGKKILIMWLPEYMGTNGNALLKIIEEPSAETLFLFVSEDKENILRTILSRTQILALPPIQEKEMIAYIREEHDLSEEEAARIAALSGGNYINALTLINNPENDHIAEFISFVRYCFNFDVPDLLAWAEKIASKGREYVKSFLLNSMQIIREAILRNVGIEELCKIQIEDEKFIKVFPSFVDPENAVLYYEALNDAHYHVSRNANPKIVFFHLSLRFNRFFQTKKKSIA